VETERLAIFDFDETAAESREWFFGAISEVPRLHGIREVCATERENPRGLLNHEILAQPKVSVWKLLAIENDESHNIKRHKSDQTILVTGGVNTNESHRTTGSASLFATH
jgi:hypothetical protein